MNPTGPQALTEHTHYHAAAHGPLHHIAIRGAVSRQAATDAALNIPDEITAPVIAAFLQDPMSREDEPSKTRAAVTSLTDALNAARERYRSGRSQPAPGDFRHYLSELLGSQRAQPQPMSAWDAAAREAMSIKAAGGLVKIEPNGRITLPDTLRHPDAVAATLRSVSTAEAIAITDRIADAARAASPAAPEYLRRIAQDAAAQCGTTCEWTEQKNQNILDNFTLRLIRYIIPSRRSLDTYNRIRPIAHILGKVLDRTPAVALLWLDSVAYCIRRSEGLDQLTNVQSPGDIVRIVQAMAPLAPSAWKRLAKANHLWLTKILPDLHRTESAAPALADPMAEQHRWRKPLYDLMEIRAEHGRDPKPQAESLAWTSLYQMDNDGNYTNAPENYRQLVLSFYRMTDRRPITHEDTQTFHNVMDWARYETERTGRPIGKRPWNQYVMSSDRWHRENRPVPAHKLSPEELEALSWDSELPPYEDGNYLVRPLLSQTELRAEGKLMGNCVGAGSYAMKCRSGYNRIFHIETVKKTVPNVPVATVQIIDNALNNRWHVGQIQGPSSRNYRVNPGARAVARRIPDLYKKARESLAA